MAMRPSFVEKPGLTIIGLTRRYNMSNRHEIPGQWGDLNSCQLDWSKIEKTGAYGVSSGFDGQGSFDYSCGFNTTGAPPDGVASITVPAGRYAVFTFEGGLPKFHENFDYIMHEWAPANRDILVPGPNVEHYPPEFAPDDGSGPIYVWIPVAPGTGD